MFIIYAVIIYQVVTSSFLQETILNRNWGHNGMHLLVHPNGSKYWRLQYRFGVKQKMLALGVYPDVSLADARARRDEARKQIANGIDPSDKKKTDKVEQNEARTFEEVAIEWRSTNKKWSEEHSKRVLKSLADNIFPAIGKRNIAELKTRDLLVPIKVVEQSGRLEVASHLQQRSTAIMRYAVQSGLIDYNPTQEMAGAVASSNRQHRPALELKRTPELLQRIDSYIPTVPDNVIKITYRLAKYMQILVYH